MGSRLAIGLRLKAFEENLGSWGERERGSNQISENTIRTNGFLLLFGGQGERKRDETYRIGANGIS